MTDVPSTNPSLSDRLWNNTFDSSTYGERKDYQQHVLEQYKLCVEMADRVSARRSLANTFFLTVQTLLVTVIGIVFKNGGRLEPRWLILFPVIAALALCWVWWQLVRSYRQLNSAKFKVIGELEKRLPSSPFVSAEWQALGQGKDPKLYTPLTEVENWVPLIFVVLYLFGAVAITFF